MQNPLLEELTSSNFMRITVNKYEYKILYYIPDEKELNKLGSSGWELCGILNLSKMNKIMYYFKRKVGEFLATQEENEDNDY